MIKAWKTLIADDELLARERLKRLLSSFPDNFIIQGEAVNSEDAKQKIETIKPDLVFLDIEMPGENIFSVLRNLVHKPFIVFCTAFDNYALQAFQTNSVDYIVKPIDSEKLDKALRKLNKITSNSQNLNYDDLEDTIKRYTAERIPSSIPYKIGDKTILIKLSQLVYFQANEKYVDFFDTKGKAYLTDLSLKTLEQKLKKDFIRVSKSVLLNKDYVKEIHKYFRGKVIFYMDDINTTKLISGSSYSEQIKDAFEM